MISCREAAELIPLHVGDDLPGEDAARIEEHLETCALCGEEYASFAAARDALLDLREELPERGSLWEDVSRSLGGAEHPRAALLGGGHGRRPPRWAAWTGLAAAAALAAAFLPQWLASPAAPADGGDALAAGRSAEAPLIQETTSEELRDFLLRFAGREVPAETGTELLPQTTPVSAQPPARPDRRESGKVY